MHKFITWVALLIGLGRGGLISGQFMVSEVSYDGLDERIEMVWTGPEEYTGTFTIYGAKASPLHYTVHAYPMEPFLIVDKGDMIEEDWCVLYINQGLSLIDTEPIEIEIRRDDQLDDYFFIPQQTVIEYYNTRSSFTRDFSTYDIIPHPLEFSTGGNGIRNISPCLVYYSAGEIDSGGNIGKGNADIGQYEETDETDETPTYCEPEIIYEKEIIYETETIYETILQPDKELCAIPHIRITEISPHQDDVGTYMELYFGGSYSGNLELVGAGVGTASRFIDVDVETGSYLVVGLGEYDHIQQQIPGFNLRNAGEMLQVVGQCGQVMDTILYTTSKRDKSQYFSQYSGAVRLFEQEGDPSPGEEYIPPPPVSSTPTTSSTSTSTTSTQSSSSTTTTNSSPSGSETTTSSSSTSSPETTSSSPTPSSEPRIPPQVTLYGVLPDPVGPDAGNEGVMLEFIFPSSSTSSNNQVIDGLSLRVNTRTKPIPPISPGESSPIAFFDTWSLVNSEACAELLFDGAPIDILCYPRPREGVWYFAEETQGVGSPTETTFPGSTTSPTTTASTSSTSTSTVSPTARTATPAGSSSTTTPSPANNAAILRLEESLETYKLQQERNKRLLDLQKNYIDILVDTLREHYYGEENILQN